MEKTKMAGGSFLLNLKNKELEFEKANNSYTKSNDEVEDIIIEVSEKSKNAEINIKNYEKIDLKNYLDKPIEVLIKDSTEGELDDIDFEYENENEMKFYLEEKKQDVIDIEFVDIFENDTPLSENIESTLKDIINEENEQILLLKSLQEKINDIQTKLDEKDKKIIELKEENKDLQQTLMKEQDIVMKEQDLHDKTLSRVEQLLLEKRNELIERQKASKKSWLLKLIDKIKA